MKRVAICPGSFDPVTNGHIDIIERACGIFDKVIVAVLKNQGKDSLFTIEERLTMLKDAVKHLPNAEIDTFDGLLVDFADKKGAKVIIRGLRAVSDFEYEFKMASMNKKLKPDIEMVFIMTSNEYAFLSSSVVREVASFGGDVSGVVTPLVEEMLKKKYGH